MSRIAWPRADPEQIAGRLRLGIEPGLRAVCAETIYGSIYRAGQKAGRLWRYLTRRRARRRKRHGRASRDAIAEKTHISQRAGDADARATVGRWEADLVICKRSRPVLVLHERKTRITLMTRLAGKTAAETIAALTATLRRLEPKMRGSVAFDNDTCFARHMLLRGMLSPTTYFCDAYASWQKGGVENANGRIRRWLPRGTDLDEISEADIQEIAITVNLTPAQMPRIQIPRRGVPAEFRREWKSGLLKRCASCWNPPPSTSGGSTSSIVSSRSQYAQRMRSRLASIFSASARTISWSCSLVIAHPPKLRLWSEDWSSGRRPEMSCCRSRGHEDKSVTVVWPAR